MPKHWAVKIFANYDENALWYDWFVKLFLFLKLAKKSKITMSIGIPSLLHMCANNIICQF